MPLVLAACGAGDDGGPINIAIVGEPGDLAQSGVRLSPSAQHVHAATQEGLVSLDPSGEVIPAIAERWIITDDGLSYIFRLRSSNWPSGEPISAADVRIALEDRLRRLDGTSLGLDLSKITDIRAMTGRVVELRLAGPMPDLLRLLAQPELGLTKGDSGAGPMVLSIEPDSKQASLNALAPQERGLPLREDWVDQSRPLSVQALPARLAVDAFSKGDIDLLLNGTIANFPMAQLGPLSRGTVQVDPASGLLGLSIKSDAGVLATPDRREALSMAIDRNALIEPFGLGGWQANTWLVSPSVFQTSELPETRWGEMTIEERRQTARTRIAAWEVESGQRAELRIGLPDGPGADLLFEQVSQAWRTIGVTAIRAELGQGAELELVDRLARYSSARWILNQFNCDLEIGLCSPTADALVANSLSLKDVAAKESALREAHNELTAAEVFIPFGAPVRWSLVRGAVEGYQPNQWGLHPLFPLSEPTT